MIKQSILDGVERYVKDHVKPGGFLTACLSNDLTLAVMMADDENLRAIPEIVQHLYYGEVPSCCWGSPERVREWLSAPILEADREREPKSWAHEGTGNNHIEGHCEIANTLHT